MLLVSGTTLFNAAGQWYYTVRCCWSVVLHCSMLLVSGTTLFDAAGQWHCTVQCCWSVALHCSMLLVSGTALFDAAGQWYCTVRCCWSVVLHCLMLLVSTMLRPYMTQTLRQALTLFDDVTTNNCNIISFLPPVKHTA